MSSETGNNKIRQKEELLSKNLTKRVTNELEYKAKLNDEDKFSWQKRSYLIKNYKKALISKERQHFLKKRNRLLLRNFQRDLKALALQNSPKEAHYNSDGEQNSAIEKAIRTKRKRIKGNYYYHPKGTFDIVVDKSGSKKTKNRSKVRRTGLAFDVECLLHFGFPEEPETPERYEACLNALTLSGLKKRCFPVIGERDLTKVNKLIRLVHSRRHLNDLLYSENRLDGEIVESNNNESYYECRFTRDATRRGVAQGVALCELVFDGKLDNGFCLVRPPGHHCDFDRKYGFCHANNIAIAAKRLISRRPGAKVLIFDWDLHHGNGTEDIFYDEPDVVYISVHQEFDLSGKEMFPGTGAIADVGGRSARGRSVNVPVPVGCGDAEYRSILDLVVCPIVREFEPDIVLVSAGFDSAAGDPLGLLELSPQMFGYMTERLCREQLRGKVVLFLEGGYNAAVVAKCVSHCVSGLLGDAVGYSPQKSCEPDFLVSLDNIIRGLRVYWKSLYASVACDSASASKTASERKSHRFRARLRDKKLVALKRFQLLHPDEFRAAQTLSSDGDDKDSSEEEYVYKSGHHRPQHMRFEPRGNALLAREVTHIDLTSAPDIQSPLEPFLGFGSAVEPPFLGFGPPDGLPGVENIIPPTNGDLPEIDVIDKELIDAQILAMFRKGEKNKEENEEEKERKEGKDFDGGGVIVID